MPDAETVVEAIQESAAQNAVSEVTAEVRSDTAVVAAEVAIVGAELADHAELSEERHDEILGDTQWLKTQLESLSNLLMTLQAAVTLIAVEVASVKSELQKMTQSTVTPVSVPNPEAPIVEVPVVTPEVTPESAVEENPVPKTEVKKRRHRVI
jgi:hypothetical protein